MSYNNSNQEMYNTVNDLVVRRMNNLVEDEIDEVSWILANKDNSGKFMLFDDTGSEIIFKAGRVGEDSITIWIHSEDMDDEFADYCQTDSEGYIKNIISLNDY